MKSKLSQIMVLARQSKGMTLRDVEAASGVSNPLISQLETGSHTNPSIDTLFAIADAYGLPYQVFMAAAYRDRTNAAKKGATSREHV